MAQASRYGGRPGPGGAGAPPPRKVDGKLKAYNGMRWMNYLLIPFLGICIICAGIGVSIVNGTSGNPINQEVARTLIIGGGILGFIGIYYNKR